MIQSSRKFQNILEDMRNLARFSENFGRFEKISENFNPENFRTFGKISDIFSIKISEDLRKFRKI